MREKNLLAAAAAAAVPVLLFELCVGGGWEVQEHCEGGGSIRAG